LKTYTVVFAPEAQDNLVELYEYIAKHGSPPVALRYTNAIVTYCDGLSSFLTEARAATTCDPG
jgi:plasmid stabilization system protein ParE